MEIELKFEINLEKKKGTSKSYFTVSFDFRVT